MNPRGGRKKSYDVRKLPGPEAELREKIAAMGGLRARFLAAYAITANLTQAAELACCSRLSHYDWMKSDPDYPELFKEAEMQAIERLEHRARERAMEGSDTLMIFLLKRWRPDLYRDMHHMYVDGKVKHTGEVDVNHKAADEITVDELPLEMRRQLLDLIRKKKEAELRVDKAANSNDDSLCPPDILKLS